MPLRLLRSLRDSRTAALVSIAGVVGFALYLAVSKVLVDIDVYVMGGRHLFSDLYTVQLGNSGLVFTYTPFAALLIAPVAWVLPYSAVQVVWTLANVAALVWFLQISVSAARPATSRSDAWWWALVLSAPALFLDPVYLTIGLGQVNLMLGALVLWDFVGHPPGTPRRVPLGVATGIAAAVKLTPLIFVVYLLVTRRTRAAATSLATFVACQALGFAVSPRASWTFWTRDVLDPSRVGGLLYISDQNLSSTLQRLHHGAVPAGVLWPLIAVAAVGGLALSVYAQRRSSELLGVLVVATTGLVVSPVTWTHHMVWVVPAIMWLVWAADRPRRGLAWATGALLLFWASPIWWVPRSWRPVFPLPELGERGWQLVAGNSFFFATVVFLAGVAVMLSWRGWRPRRRGQATVETAPPTAQRWWAREGLAQMRGEAMPASRASAVARSRS
jgi:alpha-1,2-mannosyltransferase